MFQLKQTSLCCIGVVAEISETDIFKPGQIKPASIDISIFVLSVRTCMYRYLVSQRVNDKMCFFGIWPYWPFKAGLKLSQINALHI